MKTVSKPTAQKILVALAEKGEITQKSAGKQTYFVANQVRYHMYRRLRMMGNMTLRAIASVGRIG